MSDLCSDRVKLNPIKEHNTPIESRKTSIKGWERFLIPFTLNRIRNKY